MVTFSPALPDTASLGDAGHVSDHNSIVAGLNKLNGEKVDYGSFTAKGTLVIGSAANAVGTLTVGTNNQVLIADSAQALGVKWGQLPETGLADSAVTTNKIADGAVTSAKIADGAITAAKMQRQVGNLLTDNQASGGDVLGNTTGFGTWNAEPSYSGGRIVGTKNVGPGTGWGVAINPKAAVTPGETYTIYAQSERLTGAGISTTLWWSDASNNSLGGVSVISWTTATGVQTGQIVATAPANAAWAEVFIYGADADANGSTVAVHKVGLWRGAGGTWQLPGVPVPGQSRIAVNNAVDLSGTGSPEGVVTAAPGSTWLQTDATTDVKGWIRWVKATGTGNTGWVAGAEIAAGAVGTSELADGAVTAAKIADDTITAAQIAANAVTDDKIASGAVGTSELADSAVTSAKIADGTIVSGDVAADTFAPFGHVGSLLTSDQAGGYSGWGSDGTVDYWGGGDFAITSAWSYVFSSTRCAVTAGDTVTIQAELQPVGAGAYVVTQFFTALEGGDAVGGERYGNTVPAGGNALSTLTTVVPATATAMTFLIYGGTSHLHVRHPGIWKGAGGVWALPGTPIVGLSSQAVNNAVDLSGTGTPEGVITAAPGSTWLQTDSTTDVKGWIKWVKATGTGNTGWVAGPEADTGWRLVTAALGSASDLLVRRQGRLISVKSTTYTAPGGGLSYGTGFYSPPTGFRNTRQESGVGRNGTSGSVVVVTGDETYGLYFLATLAASDPVYFSLSYTTDDAWPSSLPGSAA